MKKAILAKQEARRLHGDRGFTLIELLVVIVILGILAAVVVFAVGGITDRGEDSACEADKRAVRTAQEAHYANTTPPAYAADMDALVPAYLADASELYTTTGAGGSYTIGLTAAGTAQGCTV